MRYKKLMLYLKEESILEKTTKELRNRNKIIRIADKYGWDVVEEYMDDPITDELLSTEKLCS
jgi:lipoprotein NlpI